MYRVLKLLVLLAVFFPGVCLGEYNNGTDNVPTIWKYRLNSAWTTTSQYHLQSALWVDISGTPGNVCGTSTVLDTDTFSGTLAGFLDNTYWAIGSGEVYGNPLSSTARMTRSSTTAGAECQWREIVVGSDFTDNYLGVILRAEATGLRYAPMIKNNAPIVGQATLLFYVYNGTTQVEQIGANIVIQTAIVTGDKLAFQVYGIGDNTTFNFWLNGVGNKPSDYGSPDYTMTDNPINPVNAGSRSGLFTRDWTTTANKITATSGGSVE